VNKKALEEIVRGSYVEPATHIAATNGHGRILEAGKLENPLEGVAFPESLRGRYSLPFTPLSLAVENVAATPEWLWDGLLAPGALTLMGGKPKDGKTTLMCGLIRALERGEPFLGLPTRKTRSLVLTEERTATLAQKYERWGIDPYLLFRHDVGNAKWPDVVEESVRFCHEHGCGLLVVDTVAEFSLGAGDAENHPGAVLEQLRPLQHAAASRLAVLAQHHLKKGNAEGWDAFRGSGAFQGAADILMRLTRKGDEFRQINAEGRFDQIPPVLTYRLAEDGFVSSLPPTESDGVVSALEEAGAATPEQLAETVGLSVRAVRGHLSALHAKGLIGRTGAGKRGDPFVYYAAPKVPGNVFPFRGDSSFPASRIPGQTEIEVPS
jgi:hypothetical protein